MKASRTRVLVLGGSGYIGSRLCTMLRDGRHFEGISASSRQRSDQAGHLQLDTRNLAALTAALQDVDAVVNCVAGDARSIAEGAQVLAQAAAAAGHPRIVHLSSMSVYGTLEGEVSESSPTSPALGWYGRAKCEAETHVAAFAKTGGTAVVLRPGCVWGPGSQLWVGRVGRWLHAGRLGDLGTAGDGWSNLVHVDDVCHAIMLSLRLDMDAGERRTYNLAAPDSPRWNEYFMDLALAIGAIPVGRVLPVQLKLDAWLCGPALHLLRKAFKRRGSAIPEPISPGLLGLWQRHLHLNSDAAARQLELSWTPYGRTLQEAASSFLRSKGGAGASPSSFTPSEPSVVPRQGLRARD